jgi:hypothetical protein
MLTNHRFSFWGEGPRPEYPAVGEEGSSLGVEERIEVEDWSKGMSHLIRTPNPAGGQLLAEVYHHGFCQKRSPTIYLRVISRDGSYSAVRSVKTDGVQHLQDYDETQFCK